MPTPEIDDVRKAVREKYGEVARSLPDRCGGQSGGCCSGIEVGAPDAASLVVGYTVDELSSVPEGSSMGLGCGNPIAIASLALGDTVLDLGSGGGFDCFLAAHAVGQAGHVIGVDATPEMVSRSRRLATEHGFDNVEFRLGEIEHLPVPDASVDVIISNCVINLAPNKPRVFEEAFRALKPGGRLAVSDVVATTELPDEIKADMNLYTGCIAGAAVADDLELMLKGAGFVNVRIQPQDESKDFIREWAPGLGVEDLVVSATIEAEKPTQ